MVVAKLNGFGQTVVVGADLGAVLAFASVKFYVKEDNRKEELTALLPGYNCGACGNPGCAAMAVKLLDGQAQVEQCKPSKPDQREAIKAYLAEHVGQFKIPKRKLGNLFMENTLKKHI